MNAIPHFLYLHGFLSGPNGGKAHQMADYMAERGLADHFHAPALPTDPLAAMIEIEAEIIDLDFEPFVLIGSSLGGYYATVLAEKWNAPAVLLNPAVRPWEFAEHFVGVHTHYQTGERVVVRPDFVSTLHDLAPEHVDPRRYWLLACLGDEVLDTRRAADYYAGSRQTLLDGGSHAFEMFGDYLDEIVAWGAAQAG